LIGKDDAVASMMANHLGIENHRSSLFLEGGAIEGNGNGVIITTESVALNRNRNPDTTKQDIEAEFKKMLGTERVCWLTAGISGDDTDGHVDDLTRFIQEDALVTAREKSPTSPNYKVLEANREILQDLRTSSNSNIEVIDLPMPDPIHASSWRLDRLPASYANFLITNTAVIVPTFGQHKNDDRAMGILRECFSNRRVVGIDCRDLIMEGGAIHCISQQEPI